jgi:pyridoxal phosphate enzyme (YggS family)
MLDQQALSQSSCGDRIAKIRQTLPPSVRLIAVTKQVPIATMREAYAAGIRDFGESKVQEAEAKQQELKDLPDLTWHLIGHLQSNKARKALELFQWIHSVDSLALAQRLDQLAASIDHSPQICLQVKMEVDDTKFGWSPAQLLADLPTLNTCMQLQIQGLMTILPRELTSKESLNIFQNLHTLSVSIAQQNLPYIKMVHLSMGMSEDYPLAIQAGATMIRLGRILFGDRNAEK